MNDQLEVGKIFGIIASRVNLNVQPLPRELTEPARNLHPPDIILRCMVRTCFRNQNLVSRTQRVNRGGSARHQEHIAFQTRKQDGKSRARNPRRSLRDHSFDNLRIADDQIRRILQILQNLCVAVLFDRENRGVVVERIADGLHLRQNQTPFRSLQINRDNQHYQSARLHEIADQRWSDDKVFRHIFNQSFLEIRDIVFAFFPVNAADGDRRFYSGLLQSGEKRCVRLP